MTEVELTRTALQELGESASNEQFAAWAHERHRAHLDPRFIPVYRATIRGEEQSRWAREEAARILAHERKEA